MSILRIKIRDKYIQHIAEYSKKHEYRLAYDKYLNVKKGDMLIMVSNQDPSNSIKVVVNNIKKYTNWDLALEENWQDDFRGLYDNKEQVLKECYKFYPKEEEVNYLRNYKSNVSNKKITPGMLLHVFKREEKIKKNNVALKEESLYEYFTPGTPKDDMEVVILKLLQMYKNKEITLT